MLHLTFCLVHRRELGLSVLNMKIEWLGLTSLKRVARGHVAIAWNDNLCYVDDLDLSPLFAHQTTQEIKRSGNKDQKLCGKYTAKRVLGHKKS